MCFHATIKLFDLYGLNYPICPERAEAPSPYLTHMRKFSLDKLHQILKKMACRKNSIDNEQDNIMYFATFVVYLPPKRTNKRVDSKNNI